MRPGFYFLNGGDTMSSEDDDTYDSPVERILRTRQIFTGGPMAPDVLPEEQPEAEEISPREEDEPEE
jgi:hypothetical protein